jgi:type I restriction enzyme S subunit
MSNELPQGWIMAKLDEVVSSALGGDWGKGAEELTEGLARVRVIRGTEFKTWRDNRGTSAAERYVKISSLEKRRLRKGDLVLEVSGGGPNQPVGRTVLIDDEALNRTDAPLICSNFFRLLRFYPEIEPQFLSHFLDYSYARGEFDDFQTETTNLRNLNVTEFLGKTEVTLAPHAEQRRIVAKLEKLLDRMETCQRRLAKIPTLLKRFRQAILSAACSGRLTADWREKNLNLESGATLLARIKEERLKTAVSAKEKRQIVEPLQEERLALDEDELGFDSVPRSWFACRIGAIGTVVNGSTPSRKQEKFWDGKIPWVSSGEVRNTIISSTRERITKAGFEGSSVRLLPRGTVLLAMIGEGKTRGQSAILQIEATINQNIAAILIPHGLVSSEFLWRWFQLQYEATRERGGGSGPQALNCQRVRELPFVLPPLAEQQEIVRRVENLFALADRIESRFAAGRKQVGSITQAILAKAFRGELVPTEFDLANAEGRTFESAEELLKKIGRNGKPRREKIKSNGSGV